MHECLPCHWQLLPLISGTRHLTQHTTTGYHRPQPVFHSCHPPVAHSAAPSRSTLTCYYLIILLSCSFY
ncbi:hypothetical protein M405DRAFT_237932 [Rhizopogon salebrosus TDB-379]|nr:hypothetical protein M405DRAFT_237932 [Rhizopogon salebrosus TDB-379]